MQAKGGRAGAGGKGTKPCHSLLKLYTCECGTSQCAEHIARANTSVLVTVDRSSAQPEAISQENIFLTIILIAPYTARGAFESS
jgi:hypothetical protein